MKTLIVCATKIEINDFLINNKFIENTKIKNLYESINIDILISGIGSAHTIFNLTFVLSKKKYKSIINIGIAGAYNKNLKLGELVVVKQDTFADLGIDDNGQFKTLEEEKLSNQENIWFLSDNILPDNYKNVSAITVNTASGSAEIINKLQNKFKPDIETMEGAGVYFVSKGFNIPSVQIRAISNYVEPRNKTNWDINLALNNLAVFLNEQMYNFY